MKYILEIICAIGIMAFIIFAYFGFLMVYNIIHYIFFEPSKNTNGDIDECIGCKNDNCKNCKLNNYKEE